MTQRECTQQEELEISLQTVPSVIFFKTIDFTQVFMAFCTIIVNLRISPLSTGVLLVTTDSTSSSCDGSCGEVLPFQAHFPRRWTASGCDNILVRMSLLIDGIYHKVIGQLQPENLLGHSLTSVRMATTIQNIGIDQSQINNSPKHSSVPFDRLSSHRIIHQHLIHSINPSHVVVSDHLWTFNIFRLSSSCCKGHHLVGMKCRQAEHITFIHPMNKCKFQM